MAREMRFSQFIIDEVEGCGAFIAYGFMSDQYVVPNYRYNDEAVYTSDVVKTPEDKDDWSFSAGWTLRGYYAHICRGPDYLSFTVRGKEALALLLIQDRLEQEAKERKWRKKNAYKAALLDAEWWP